jgi:protein subunit release factor B
MLSVDALLVRAASLRLCSSASDKWLRAAIPSHALRFAYSRSSGPGGRHANSTCSKATARLQVRSAAWLPAHVRDALLRLFGGRLNAAGELLVVSQRTRCQATNKEDCLLKLRQMLQQAASASEPPQTPPQTSARVAAKKAAFAAAVRREKQARAHKKSQRRACVLSDA